MNAALLAHNILGDLWEFGRIVLIMLGACCWNWLIRRGRDDGGAFDLAALLLIATCSIGALGLFFFLNIQMGNILALFHLAPLWVGFSGVSLIALVVTFGLVTHQQLGANNDELSLSILDESQARTPWLNPRRALLGFTVATFCCFASVVWLWLIAQSRVVA